MCTGSGSTPCDSSSWQDVTTDVAGVNVGDDLASAGYNGSTGTNLWNGAWDENDFPDGSNRPNVGNVQIVTLGGSRWIRLDDASGNGGNSSRRSAISRSVDLSGAGGGQVTLRFAFLQNGLDNNERIDLEARGSSSASWDRLATYDRNTSSGTQTIILPSSVISGATEIRFRVRDDLENNEYALIGDIEIAVPGVDAWCAYSASSPVTAAPGFHCLGPTVSLANGAQWLVDTTGGPLTFYYTDPAITAD